MPTTRTSDPAAAATKPRLPRSESPGADALTALRRFHYRLPEAGGGELPAGLLPALLHPFRHAEVRTEYPVYLPADEGGEEAMPLSFGDLVERAAPAGDKARLLSDNLRRFERFVRREAAAADGPADARELLATAGEALRDDLGLPADDDSRLAQALGELVSAVPAGSTLVPWRADVPLHLLRQAVRARLRSARKALLEEARQLSTGVTAMLGGSTKGEGAVGSVGSRFVNTSRLAGVTGASRRATTMSDERRQRLETVRETLDRFVAGGTEPELNLVAEEDLAPADAPEGWTLNRSDRPFADAAELFDAAAGELAAVLRALRAARLEMSGDYLPERHGPVLERLDWHSFSRQERSLLAPVVVMADADHAAGEGLLALSRLLLSGRPVQVLLQVDPAINPGEGEEEASGFRFEPASLGVGHREAFVQQSSLARPVHLAAGFARALDSGRTALHVLDHRPAPDADDPAATVDPWLLAGAALEGRAHPLFLFDPAAGEGWARRLDFSRNPEPRRDWPQGELVAAKADGGDETLSPAFTFADYALLDPRWRRHFRTVPPGLEHDDLVPLAEWTDLGRDDAAHALPWTWAVDGEGGLHRLLVDRELALACRDRLDFWRTLQEMAGVKSEYAERAAEEARGEAARTAREERERLEAEHAAELERVRRQAAEEVVDRLTSALLEVDVSGLPRPAAAGAAGLSLPAGGNVDDVAATLLQAVGPDALEGDGGEPSSPQVAELTSRLLSLIDTESLESEDAGR